MRNLTRHGMCARISLATLALSLVAGPVAAGLGQTTVRRFVDVNVVSEGNGTSWGSAYKDLQDALTEGGVDEVWVAAGTYKPGSEQSDRFDLPDGIEVYGGFHGDEDPATFPLDDRDFVTDLTTLSGDIDNDGTLNAANSQHVVEAVANTLDTVLDGFTVTFGYADGGYPDFDGGGMRVKDCSNVTIANCIFENNHAERLGGAMFVFLGIVDSLDDSDVTIADCEFNDNDSVKFGGAVNFLKDPAGGPRETTYSFTVLRTEFNRNKTDDFPAPGGRDSQGGAIRIEGADIVTITDCDFNENFATYAGGALTLYAVENSVTGNSTVEDCTFTGNGIENPASPDRRSIQGGAVFVYNATKTEFIDCTFTENETERGSGALWGGAAGTPNRSWTMELNMTGCKFFRNRVQLVPDQA